MPRQKRVKSQTGVYHIMLRGINQQKIFEDNEDYEKFLLLVEEAGEVELVAHAVEGSGLNQLAELLADIHSSKSSFLKENLNKAILCPEV